MANRIAICILLLFSIPSLAQESNSIQYEHLLTEMNDRSLPLVNITTDVDSLSGEFYQGYIEFSQYNQADESVEKQKFPCDLRYRGGTARDYDKKSFAIKLRHENGDDWDADLFGIRKTNSWILDAMSIDRIRMRNRVCFDLWNELNTTPYSTDFDGRNGTKGQFVEVFINGNYNGLYCLTDKINRKLLNLKSAKVESDGTHTIRGVMYKGNRWQDVEGEATDIFLLSYKEDKTDSRYWNAWELQYPEDYPARETWQPLMDLIDFCSEGTSTEVFNREWSTYFDAENLSDYMVFTLALNVGDNAYKNTFLSTRDVTVDHQFILTPWDMDMSLGGLYEGSYYDVCADIHRYDWIAPFNRLFVSNVDGFYDLVKSKWETQRDKLFSKNHVFGVLDNYSKMFVESGAWERECTRWSGNPVPLKNDINDEMDYVKNWYVKNCDSLNYQFVNTGINKTTYHENLDNAYTIDGRRFSVGDLEKLPKGIYIINRKKVIVR